MTSKKRPKTEMRPTGLSDKKVRTLSKQVSREKRGPKKKK